MGPRGDPPAATAGAEALPAAGPAEGPSPSVDPSFESCPSPAGLASDPGRSETIEGEGARDAGGKWGGGEGEAPPGGGLPRLQYLEAWRELAMRDSGRGPRVSTMRWVVERKKYVARDGKEGRGGRMR